MIGIIAAVTLNGVIGENGKLPFNYKEDMQHFKKTTMGSVVIMGRKTFESIGRSLPGRENIIITSRTDIPSVTCLSSVKGAIASLKGQQKDVWLIGGASIYEEGMLYADKILLTLTPDYNNGKEVIKFPWINPAIFWCKGSNYLDIDNPNKLMISSYERLLISPYQKELNSLL